MKIIPFHFITKPQNTGYRDCVALLHSHPQIEVVSKLEDADYVFYWSWGDDPAINNDLDEGWKNQQLAGIPWLLDVTGDKCWIRGNLKGLAFTTCPAKFLSLEHGNQFQIPYSYRRFAAGNNLPITDTKRDLLASFQGSFATNPKRRELLQFASPDIFIKEQDGWNLSSPDNERVIREHDELLLRSKFTFCPVGHGLSSIRVTDAIFHGSIPILIDDNSSPFGADITFTLRANYEGLHKSIEWIYQMQDWEYELRIQQMLKFKNEFLLRDARKGIVNELGYLDYILEKAVNYKQKHHE